MLWWLIVGVGWSGVDTKMAKLGPGRWTTLLNLLLRKASPGRLIVVLFFQWSCLLMVIYYLSLVTFPIHFWRENHCPVSMFMVNQPIEILVSAPLNWKCVSSLDLVATVEIYHREFLVSNLWKLGTGEGKRAYLLVRVRIFISLVLTMLIKMMIWIITACVYNAENDGKFHFGIQITLTEKIEEMFGQVCSLMCLR